MVNARRTSRRRTSGSRILCLSPDCYKLWALRPGLCFLYDSIVIDSRDYDDIMQSSEDSSYNFLLSRNVRRLQMEGILQVQSFRPFLPPATRAEIHDKADRYVGLLPGRKRFALALHAHEEFRHYLKSQLLFCRTDEPKYEVLVERLTKVEARLASLRALQQPTPETDETLKRIAAKSLAGACIVPHFQGAHLYDTSEYRPFIKTVSLTTATPQRSFIQRYDTAEDRAVDIVAAIVLSKRLPDVTVYDDHSLTLFMRTRDDLDRLRSVIEEVLERYRELIAADPEVAWQHLCARFVAAVENIDRELRGIARKTGILWKITEILASIKFSLLKPFLQPLATQNMALRRASEIKKLGSRDELLRDLICVFDQVRFGRRKYEIAPDKTFRGAEKSKRVIWGQRGHLLPWYERSQD